MPRDAKVFDIFLSSPGDVANDRELISRVTQDWNLNRGRHIGVFFSVLTWENTVSSSLHDRPQAIINEQIGDNYDIYLGLMSGKFGTATGIAESGTVEEFNRALDRYRSGDSIRLAMLFKTADIPFNLIDANQLSKVQEFKKRYSDEGGLYREYENEESLIRLVNSLLDDFIKNASDQINLTDRLRIDNTQPYTKKAHFEYEDDDLGLFDINDQLSKVTAEQVGFFEKMNKISDRNTEETSEISDKMNSLSSIGQANQENIRPLTTQLSNGMDELSLFIENHIKDYIENNERIATLSEAGLDISRDFSGEENDREEFIAAVEGAASGLLANANANADLVSTIESLPRIDKKLNKSRKRLMLNLKALDESARSTSEKMMSSIKMFR